MSKYKIDDRKVKDKTRRSGQVVLLNQKIIKDLDEWNEWHHNPKVCLHLQGFTCQEDDVIFCLTCKKILKLKQHKKF